MLVTKEMLAELRTRASAKIAAGEHFSLRTPPRIDVDPQWIIAVIDERKALRDATLSLMGGDSYSTAYAARALGEDE